MTSRRAGASRAASAARKLARAALVGARLFALAATLLVGPGAALAQADPPLTIAEAKTQIEQFEVEAAALDQQYVGIREELRTDARSSRSSRPT